MDFLYAAPECQVVLEARAEQALRLRPACPLGFSSTHGAVRALLEQAGAAPEVRLHFGRIVEYPWLSSLVARQASSSRVWDPVEGRARGEPVEQYLTAALRGMPEFTALFDRWSIVSVSVEKVQLKRVDELPLAAGTPLPADARLPYDALLIVELRR
jgi:hypothetical protein